MSKDNRMRYALIEGSVVDQAEQPKYGQNFQKTYKDCLFVSESGIVGVEKKSCKKTFVHEEYIPEI